MVFINRVIGDTTLRQRGHQRGRRGQGTLVDGNPLGRRRRLIPYVSCFHALIPAQRVVDLAHDTRGVRLVQDLDVHLGVDAKHCIVRSPHDQLDVLVEDHVLALADLQLDLLLRLHWKRVKIKHACF